LFIAWFDGCWLFGYYGGFNEISVVGGFGEEFMMGKLIGEDFLNNWFL
jgi:hypothetical protein